MKIQQNEMSVKEVRCYREFTVFCTYTVSKNWN